MRSPFARGIAPAGVAQDVHVACPMIYDPVCDTDGRTHGNGCLARMAGVDIAYRGTCDPGPVRPAAGPAPLPGPGEVRPIPKRPDVRVICPQGQEYALGQCRDLCAASKPRDPATGLCTSPPAQPAGPDDPGADGGSFWSRWSPTKKILVAGLGAIALGSVGYAVLADDDPIENPGRGRHARRRSRRGRRRP